MKNFVRLVVCLSVTVLLFGMANIAGATPIISMLGDMDGFGLGTKPGETFNIINGLPWHNNNPPDDLFTTPPLPGPIPLGTDAYVSGNQTWTHTYSPPTSVHKYAYIDIFAGGLGSVGPASLYMDSTFIGNLSIGQPNIARLDRFTLNLADLDGSNDFEIRLAQSTDVWVMDYSRLVVTTPEPGTLLLLGTGLAGLAGYGRIAARRRRKKS